MITKHRRRTRCIAALPTVVAATLLFGIALSGDVNAQAFPNDNDGLLDVGEAPGFPADPASALGELDLRFKGIEDLDGTSLLTNLQVLRLQSNQITSIESGDFIGLTSLQGLGLGHNQIRSIESGGFDGLSNLQELQLQDNQITSVESGDFDGLTNLHGLNLARNEINSIDSGSFSELASLQWLNLGANHIPSIPSGAFHGLTDMQSLTLDGNEITSIESGIFDGLTNLQELKLFGNQITSIESGIFDGLTNLQELKLFDNQITSIESGTFDGLTNLQTLDLARNEIASIEIGNFNGLISLAKLDLSENQLAKLNLTRATFENLQPLSIPLPGLLVSGVRIDDTITSLVLDHAELSQSSFNALVDAIDRQTSLADVSLVNLAFTDEHPSDLNAILGIPSLDNVRVDRSLYSLYNAEFDTFDAIAGNTVTVVPEPSSALLLILMNVVWLRCRNMRR